MASPDAAIERWFAVQRGQSSRYLSCRNVVSTDGALYSYGRHFPMVKPIKNKHGARIFWLVNGDVASVTTSRQQGMVRGHLRDDLTVTIPFSVLDAAGIDHSTVRLLEATPDRWVTTHHSSPTPPPRLERTTWERTTYVDWTDEEVLAYAEREYCNELTTMLAYAKRSPYWQTYIDEHLTLTPVEYMERHTGSNDWHTWRRRSRKVVLGSVQGGFHAGYRTVHLIDTADGPRYQWETTRHWLGESLIEARVPGPVRKTACTHCGGTGWRRIAPAYSSWRGQPQYDGSCTCIGGKQHKRTWRTAKFLSGFDRNETRPSYFFCELPKTDATTVEEAYEALKPRAVKLAEQVGRPVARQGDIFAISQPTVTRKTLTAAGATFATRKGGRTVVDGVVTHTTPVAVLLGTNHVATESATLPDGTLYARGCLYHVPDFREPDHARCKLPDGWSLIVKNLVPLTR